MFGVKEFCQTGETWRKFKEFVENFAEKGDQRRVDEGDDDRTDSHTDEIAVKQQGKPEREGKEDYVVKKLDAVDAEVISVGNLGDRQ